MLKYTYSMRPKTCLQTLFIFTVLALSGCANTQVPLSTRPAECVPEIFIKAVESCYSSQLCINRMIKQYIESCDKEATMVQADLEACGQDVNCMNNIIKGFDKDIISPSLPPVSVSKPPPVESISSEPDNLPPNWRSVHELLGNLQKKLETSIPAKLRHSVDEAVQDIPISGKALPAPFIMDIQRKGEVNDTKIIPTRRDWAYALYGAMYLNSEIAIGNNAGLADISFWCFIKAALLADEAEHYANIAFFLNIMRRYEDAILTLNFANELDSNHPDVHGELSFSLRRLGREDEANDALIKAINLERTANATEAEVEPPPKARNPLPPNDEGTAYVEFNYGYSQAEAKFYDEYLPAMGTALQSSWANTVPSPDPQLPIQVLIRRSKANESALNQCYSGIRHPGMPCPFGAGIYHPLCRNKLDGLSVKTIELQNDIKRCECDVAYWERIVSYQHAFINDVIEMAKTFDRIWTPKLERFVRYWQGEIAYVNEVYSDPAYKWPINEPYNILKFHYDFLKRFENETLPSLKQELEGYKIQLQAKARECTKRAKKLAAFKEVAFAFKPIRCAEEVGSHHKLDIGIFKWELFIGDKGTLATSIDADLGVANYSVTAGPDGYSHKITAKTPIFSPDLHILPSGDWGVGGSFSVNILEPVVGKMVGRQLKNIAGKNISLPDAMADGKKVGEAIGNFLKLETKYEVTPDFRGAHQGKFVKPEITFGYSERRTVPPSWIRFNKRTDRMHPVHYHGGPPPSGVGRPASGWCW